MSEEQQVLEIVLDQIAKGNNESNNIWMFLLEKAGIFDFSNFTSHQKHKKIQNKRNWVMGLIAQYDLQEKKLEVIFSEKDQKSYDKAVKGGKKKSKSNSNSNSNNNNNQLASPTNDNSNNKQKSKKPTVEEGKALKAREALDKVEKILTLFKAGLLEKATREELKFYCFLNGLAYKQNDSKVVLEGIVARELQGN